MYRYVNSSSSLSTHTELWQRAKITHIISQWFCSQIWDIQLKLPILHINNKHHTRVSKLVFKKQTMTLKLIYQVMMSEVTISNVDPCFHNHIDLLHSVALNFLCNKIINSLNEEILLVLVWIKTQHFVCNIWTHHKRLKNSAINKPMTHE